MCVWFSYVRIVGDVRLVFFFGMIVFRIFIRCFGSCFASSSRFSSDCFFACRIWFFSLFLYRVCFCLFSGVGLSSLCWCSWCCLCICRLNFVVHQRFLRFLGLFSFVPIVCWIAFCILWKCCDVVVCGFASFRALVMAVSMSIRMVSLCLLYWAVVSVFVVFIFRGVGLCMMVHVGKWSAMGGDIVSAVISVSVIVVRVLSMKVDVL